jgi:lipid II:glycine glycyltransferase (peptidoglycan interpeptide bridge formation enzyme)
MLNAGLMDLFVAEWHETPINYAVVDTVSEPIYHWGATTDAAFSSGCPPTGQLLHFEAMCRYRREGRALYDLGGAPGARPTAPHPNLGVWRFKFNFGGRYVPLIGEWHLELGLAGKIWNRLRAASRSPVVHRRRVMVE